MSINVPKIKLLTTREVAEHLGIPVSGVLGLIHKGELKAVTIGHGWRVSESSLRDWIKRNFGKQNVFAMNRQVDLNDESRVTMRPNIKRGSLNLLQHVLILETQSRACWDCLFVDIYGQIACVKSFEKRLRVTESD